MKNWKILFYISIMFWPLSLYFSDTKNIVILVLPGILILISYFCYPNHRILSYLSFFTIALFQEKLLITFPIFFLMEYIFSEQKRPASIFLILSFVYLLMQFRDLFPQTIFFPDYQARQEVIRNTHLYDQVLFARAFQNKLIIIANKFLYNFFALSDPNNYFFGFAPRQIVGNLNLVKYPFLSLAAFLVILTDPDKMKHYFKVTLKVFGNTSQVPDPKLRFFVFSAISSLVSLSTLNTFDKTDFIIWFFILVVLYKGFELFSKKKLFKFYIPVFFLFSFIEIIRICLS